MGDARTDRSGENFLEFIVAQRFINGRATMLIDLDRCTRCDDCVRACAATHDNNPRFIRQGPEASGVMVASACMHCVDPVCMIGCPTGAIHRESFAGQVVINEIMYNPPIPGAQYVELYNHSSNFNPADVGRVDMLGKPLAG